VLITVYLTSFDSEAYCLPSSIYTAGPTVSDPTALYIW